MSEYQDKIQQQSQKLEEESNNSFDDGLNQQFRDLETKYQNLGYKRIDESVFAQFTQAQLEKNAIHGPLTGYNMIAKYHVYQNEEISKNEVICLIQVGDRLCGHPEIVHGGIISAIFDNNFGWLFIASKEKPGFTANLNINFRKPTYANSVGIIRTKLDRIEGRKIFMSATWESTEGVLQADATTLFVRPRTTVANEEGKASV